MKPCNITLEEVARLPQWSIVTNGTKKCVKVGDKWVSSSGRYGEITLLRYGLNPDCMSKEELKALPEYSIRDGNKLIEFKCENQSYADSLPEGTIVRRNNKQRIKLNGKWYKLTPVGNWGKTKYAL